MKKTNKTTLGWIAAAIRSQLVPIIILVIVSCLIACINSVAALITRGIIDNATAGIINEFVFYSALLVLLFGFRIAMNATRKYLTERCRTLIEISLRRRFFSLILKKDYGSISAHHSGELLNRMTNDVTVISEAATAMLPEAASLVVRFICALIVILMLEPLFGLLYTAGGLAVFFLTRLLRTRIKKLHKKAQQADDNTRSFWQESVSNLLAIKVFGATERMNEKSDELQKIGYRAKMKKAKFSVFASLGYSFVLAFGYVFAFIWCGVKLMNGSMSFGTLSAVTQLISQLQAPFSGMSGIFTQYYIAIASAERLIEIEQLPDDKQVKKINPLSMYEKMSRFELRGVSFAYDRELIMNELDLEIKKGEFIGIVGNSGIGKSTLFMLLLGVYSPNQGSIRIVGDGVNESCTAATRPLFSYVPQGNLLFSGTIRDNITFVRSDTSEQQLQDAVRISCADEFICRLPDGLDTQIGERGFGLSEGQVQRIALARAIVMNAPVLLLDEATSALDSNTEARVLQNLRSMENVTCIIVTHRKQALSVCDKTLEMREGKIIEKQA